MSSKTWILLDSVTKIQSQPLSREKLQNAILKMTERDWIRFYLWTEGWQNWQSLNDFLQSEQKEFSKNRHENSSEVTIRVTHPTKTTTPQHEQTITKSTTMVNSVEDTLASQLKDQDYDGGSLNDKTTPPPETLDFKKIGDNYRIRAERHELKIEVLLISQKGKTFKSYSKNISLSGSLLEDNIPFDFYGVQFDVVVVNRHASNPQHARVQLRSETVGEGLTQRLRFMNPTVIQKQKLLDLLNEYITQTHLKKSS